MTETKVSDLIGLSELAELLNLTKGEANAYRQRPGFPSPKCKFKMGPAWDQNEVLAYAGEANRVTVTDESGNLTVVKAPTTCPTCKDGSFVLPIPGSLHLKWEPDRGPYLAYNWKHQPCSGWGEIAFSPGKLKEDA